MVTQGWEELVSTRTKTGKTIQLLDRFNSIKEHEMKDEKVKRTLEEYNVAKNMYIAVWRLLSSSPKMEIKAHTKRD